MVTALATPGNSIKGEPLLKTKQDSTAVTQIFDAELEMSINDHEEKTNEVDNLTQPYVRFPFTEARLFALAWNTTRRLLKDSEHHIKAINRSSLTYPEKVKQNNIQLIIFKGSYFLLHDIFESHQWKGSFKFTLIHLWKF